jgi:peptide/nickel transport system substrate-binding protein
VFFPKSIVIVRRPRHRSKEMWLMTRHESEVERPTMLRGVVETAVSRREILVSGGKLAMLAAIFGAAGWRNGALAQDAGTPTPGPAAVADSSGTPKAGGTLTVLTPTDASSLHPGAKTNFYDTFWQMVLYDSLIINGFDGQPYPGLAESWEPNADGTVWTFHLRKDVTFHSGEPFTAAHVVDHFNRWKNFPSSVKVSLLEKTEAPDDYTVVCTLSSPTLVFLNNVSQTEFTYSAIPNMKKVAELGDNYGLNEADGTGPYMFKEWVKDDHLTLVRNDKYAWGPEFYDNKGTAFPDTVIYRTIPEPTSRTAMIQSGDADLNFETPPSDVEQLKSAGGVAIASYTRYSCNNIGFNVKKPLFQDVNVRRALMHAVNRDEIVQYVMFGQAEAAQGYLPPTMLGANPREVTLPYVKYDVDQAKQLLDQAGWTAGSDGMREKGGQKFSFTTYCILEEQERVCQVVQAQLKDIGVDMQIKRLEQAAWDEAMKAGEHDARYHPQFMSTPDHMYFYVGKFAPLPNSTMWADPHFDELFAKSQTTVDPAERIATFNEMEKYFLDQAVVVPIMHVNWIIAYQDKVKGTKFHNIMPLYKMMDTWIQS